MSLPLRFGQSLPGPGDDPMVVAVPRDDHLSMDTDAGMTYGALPRSQRSRLSNAAVRAAQDAVYLTLGLVTSVVAFAVWVVAVTASLSLAVFVVGLPVFLACTYAFRGVADLDRRSAALMGGPRLQGRYRLHRGGLWARVRTAGTDPRTWKDLAWLVVHSLVGFAFGVLAVSATVTVVGVALLPAWSWAVPDGVQLGLWTVDSLGEAFANALLALPLALVTVVLLRAMALAHSGLAVLLLDDAATAPESLPAHSGATTPPR
jgi:hypothetical protein